MDFEIPADMNDAGKAHELGCAAVVSIRDLMVLLGVSDEQLRDHDERAEILKREPWRRDGLRFEPLSPGSHFGVMTGEIDWSGTRFAKG